MWSRHPLGFMLLEPIPWWHLHFNVSQAAQTEHAHTRTLDFQHHPPHTDFLLSLPCTDEWYNHSLSQKYGNVLGSPICPLCRIGQCSLWSVLSSAPPVPALIQPTVISHPGSFLLHSCHLVTHYPHNCQSDVCISDCVIDLPTHTSPPYSSSVQPHEKSLSVPPVPSCAAQPLLCPEHSAFFLLLEHTNILPPETFWPSST